MKKIIAISLLICFQFSCKKDSITPTEDNSQGLATLKIDKILELLPLSTYKESLSLIYKNQNGEEKILIVGPILQELQEKRVNEDNYYMAENLRIDLLEIDRSDYYISLQAAANYTDLANSQIFINCSLYTTLTNGLIPIINIDSNSQPIICRLEKEIQLLDKTFNNVYTNYTIESLTSFSQIYYTTAQGVIAFKDENNTLWVLDRME